jgi:hypothetical protein
MYISFVFHESDYAPRNADEAAWLDLIVTTPALIEASMAIALHFWSPDGPTCLLSEAYSQQAVQHIIESISSTKAQSDGVLMAVVTMAFGARMMGDIKACETHIEGIANMIHDRRCQGIEPIVPPWMTDGLIMFVVPV